MFKINELEDKIVVLYPQNHRPKKQRCKTVERIKLEDQVEVQCLINGSSKD